MLAPLPPEGNHKPATVNDRESAPLSWSAWLTYESCSVFGTPDEPGVYEVRISPDPWIYEAGESHTVYFGAGSTDSYTRRRLLRDHIEGRGNPLLKALTKTRNLEFRHAFAENPSQALSALLSGFRRTHGGFPVCNRL